MWDAARGRGPAGHSHVTNAENWRQERPDGHERGADRDRPSRVAWGPK